MVVLLAWLLGARASPLAGRRIAHRTTRSIHGFPSPPSPLVVPINHCFPLSFSSSRSLFLLSMHAAEMLQGTWKELRGGTKMMQWVEECMRKEGEDVVLLAISLFPISSPNTPRQSPWCPAGSAWHSWVLKATY